ncbi:hypothetical protein DUI87_31282 [Hirundo rustica rustica]|uniref:G-protein coupled receptors family 2 profile 2 domain-containing protein n=1 Tax=Hirundo rustica rustica TaxID=333673 RepID=A0A3M0IS02_HIRRU|nr:hypothetical protein DUI87_31282 [Hirundo rustica rustica]
MGLWSRIPPTSASSIMIFFLVKQEYIAMGRLISLFAGLTHAQEMSLFLVLHTCHGWKMEEEHKLLTTLQMLYTIGYYFSLISLVLALLILSLLRLARSTLVLIPLLGIHEFVFTFITDEQVEGLSRHIRLFIQLTMSSFHGFLVAVLYCFANGEVKAELQKQWSRFLLADPFGCRLCFLGENIKYLRKCSQKRKKHHLSSKHLEVSKPWEMQLQQVLGRQRTEASTGPPQMSMSDSSEGEVTTGETTEEVFEESEI